MQRPSHKQAFTLVELILVMALLLIVLAVAAPSLANFFRGRTLDAEARRFLSLTHYAKSRAVGEGLPMVLWIDASRSLYGLEAAPGYLITDSNALHYALAEDLEIEAVAPAGRDFSSRDFDTGLTPDVTLPGLGRLPAIRFSPDGFIGETSPVAVLIQEKDRQAVWITQTTNRLNYAIRTNPPSELRL